MSIQLRVLLVIAAVLITVVFVRSIKKSKMRIEDTLFWAAMSLIILLLSIFPQVAIWFSDLLGFQAPVNFVFLIFIFILLIKVFLLSRENSQLHTEIKELTQEIAIEQLEHHERKNDSTEA